MGVAGRPGRPGRRPRRAQPEAGLAELVAELDQRADAQHAPTVQGVTLASLHSAKGLEWDVVFLVGLTDTTLPIQHATTDAQIAEERRLLYVGITRAREQLALSWALARSAGQRRGRRPSRFLDGLRPAGRPGPARAKRGAPRRPRGRGRRAVRAAAGLAPAAGRGPESAGLRGVLRRHPGRDQRRPAGFAGRAGPDLRRRAGQARPLRRARPGGLGGADPRGGRRRSTSRLIGLRRLAGPIADSGAAGCRALDEAEGGPTITRRPSSRPSSVARPLPGRLQPRWRSWHRGIVRRPDAGISRVRRRDR